MPQLLQRQSQLTGTGGGTASGAGQSGDARLRRQAGLMVWIKFISCVAVISEEKQRRDKCRRRKRRRRRREVGRRGWSGR